MSPPAEREHVLPTRLARRRLLAGRLVAGVLCSNLVLAGVGAWALSGPAAGLTRFRLGFAGWAGVLFGASLIVAVPVVGPIILKLLRPPLED